MPSSAVCGAVRQAGDLATHCAAVESHHVPGPHAAAVERVSLVPSGPSVVDVAVVDVVVVVVQPELQPFDCHAAGVQPRIGLTRIEHEPGIRIYKSCLALPADDEDIGTRRGFAVDDSPFGNAERCRTEMGAAAEPAGL